MLSKMMLSQSCAVSLSKTPSYVLHFALQRQKMTEVASGMTDLNLDKISTEKQSLFDGELLAIAVSGTHEIKIYDLKTFCCKKSLKGHTGSISSICFDIKQPNLLWSTSHDGTLRCWDFTKTSDESVIINHQSQAYTALGLSCDGSLLVVGSEKFSETTNLEIWDIRKADERPPKLLATFEEMHSDDITKIVFHPRNPKIVAVGSTDGLVTILDLTTYDEEDSLIQTLNTESSVSNFGFFGPSSEYMFTMTHVETLQLWDYNDGQLLASVGDVRKKISKPHRIDYVVDCLYHEASQRLFLVGGLRSGVVVLYHVNMDSIEPFQELSSGHSSIVRCIVYTKQCLLTGAEDGMMSAWIPCSDAQAAAKPAIKTKKSKKSDSRKKPYIKEGR